MDDRSRTHEPATDDASPTDEPTGAAAPTASLAARMAAGSLPPGTDPIEDRPSDAAQGYDPDAGPTAGRVDPAGATYGRDPDTDEQAALGGPVTSRGGEQRRLPDD